MLVVVVLSLGGKREPVGRESDQYVLLFGVAEE
jgi:hypothetical protein